MTDIHTYIKASGNLQFMSIHF